MELPPYLALFLWSIRMHGDEPGYLAKRFEKQPYEKVVEARGMVEELFDRHLLLALSVRKDTVDVVSPAGRAESVAFPNSFLVAPYAHHMPVTLLARFGFWAVTICLAQQLTGIVSALLP